MTRQGTWSVLEGDCLERLAELEPESADLAYLDPPFNTGRRLRDRGGDFEDRWADMGAYLDFLRPRLEALRRVLGPSGAILLHCDWRTSHHMRLLLDELFGPERFINHLIWHYGLGGSSAKRFARKHDDILYYGKGDEHYFEAPMVPATSRRMKGGMKKASDVISIPSINNMARERTGWPTQKPVALLELLVRACCPPGGLVIDPFCGSGTALAAAVGSGRRAIGIDRSADAISLTLRRLEASKGDQGTGRSTRGPEAAEGADNQA